MNITAILVESFAVARKTLTTRGDCVILCALVAVASLALPISAPASHSLR